MLIARFFDGLAGSAFLRYVWPSLQHGMGTLLGGKLICNDTLV
jgi:hypothetical protein